MKVFPNVTIDKGRINGADENVMGKRHLRRIDNKEIEKYDIIIFYFNPPFEKSFGFIYCGEMGLLSSI